MPDETADTDEDLFDRLLSGVRDTDLPPPEEISPVTDSTARQNALEAAVDVDGFREIKDYCGEEYDATFDSSRSTVLDLTGAGSLSTLVSFQARVPNSPFDDKFSEVGISVLSEDGTPVKAVGIREVRTAGTLEETTIITYEDGAVVEHTATD